MKSISEKFKHLRAEKQCALIPFITAGDPDLETTTEALGILEANGADFIELGVPYSDPLADGPGDSSSSNPRSGKSNSFR